MKTCDKCYLKDQTHVFSKGNPNSKIMIVGEALGKVEEELGEVWVGPAGQELHKALLAAGLDPLVDCYITNAVKARPTSSTLGKQNDTPRMQAIRTCFDLFLSREIQIIKPKSLVCMGRSAALACGIISSGVPMSKALTLEVYINKSTRAFVTYHPAYYLHKSSDQNFSQADITNIKWDIFNVLKRAVAHSLT